MDFDDVCVLVPTYNEAETIGDVVAEFRDAGFDDVLVVDGGSEDDTPAVAEAEGARVVYQSGSGKGQAVREAVREHVIGNRFADLREGAMTRFNQFGNRLINRGFALVHGENFTDILSGYRAFTRESFLKMTLSADGFGIETEMAVECAKRGFDTAVVPITYYPRPSGSDTNLRPIRDGGIIFLELYRRAKTNNPLFYFGSLGVLSTVSGFVIAAYVLVEWITRNISHEVLAVVSGFGIIVGVQLLMFGVLADLVLSLHRDTLQKIDEETGPE